MRLLRRKEHPPRNDIGKIKCSGQSEGGTLTGAFIFYSEITFWQGSEDHNDPKYQFPVAITLS